MLWIICATFQWPNGNLRIYTLMEVENVSSINPSYTGIGKRTFKIKDGYVSESNAGQAQIFTDCAISNKANWVCLRQNRKSKFGMRNGEFFDVWLEELIVPPLKQVYVSELDYHLNACSWDWLNGGLQILACPLRPFFNSY